MPLALHNLSFAYRPDRPVLRNLSITFVPGRLTAVVGPNGAGKSTLLRLLIGVLKPAAGRITLGEPPRDLSSIPPGDRARRIAYVAQRPTLAAAFTVREAIALGRFASSDEGAAAHANVNLPHDPISSALAALDLADRADDPFHTLSVGQQQRAALARALCQLDVRSHRDAPSTQALIVDEPTAALDPRHALATMDLLGRAARGAALPRGEARPESSAAVKRPGRIVVAAIHDVTAARRFADDALVLSETGELAAFGPAGDILTAATLEPVFGVHFHECRLGGDADDTAVIPAFPLHPTPGAPSPTPIR